MTLTRGFTASKATDHRNALADSVNRTHDQSYPSSAVTNKLEACVSLPSHATRPLRVRATARNPMF